MKNITNSQLAEIVYLNGIVQKQNTFNNSSEELLLWNGSLYLVSIEKNKATSCVLLSY